MSLFNHLTWRLAQAGHLTLYLKRKHEILLLWASAVDDLTLPCISRGLSYKQQFLIISSLLLHAHTHTHAPLVIPRRVDQHKAVLPFLLCVWLINGQKQSWCKRDKMKQYTLLPYK